jgi:hypothetical protein
VRAFASLILVGILGAPALLMAQDKQPVITKGRQIVLWDSLAQCDSVPEVPQSWTRQVGSITKISIPLPPSFHHISAVDSVSGDMWQDSISQVTVNAFVTDGRIGNTSIVGLSYISNTTVHGTDTLYFACSHCYHPARLCVHQSNGRRMVLSEGTENRLGQRFWVLAAAAELPAHGWIVVLATASNSESIPSLRSALRFWTSK